MLTKNFSTKELSCHCCGKCMMDKDFMTKLQTLRDAMGIRFNINSGFRCISHNQHVGGSLLSKHISGIAVDISTRGWTLNNRYELIANAQRLRFKGIGIGRSYVHIDTRETKSKMWVY